MVTDADVRIKSRHHDIDTFRSIHVGLGQNLMSLGEWSHGDVLALLYHSNYNETEIRVAVEEDKERGIAFALQLLATGMRNGCNLARLKRKIYHL